MKNIFALLILRVINLNFKTEFGRNPEFIHLVNHNNNSIYIKLEEDSVVISAYKVSKRCYIKSIKTIDEIETVAEELKLKVKCEDLTTYEESLNKEQEKQLDFLARQAQDLNLGYE